MTTIITQPFTPRRPVTIAAYPASAGDAFIAGEQEALATNPTAALENLEGAGYLGKPYNRAEVLTGQIEPKPQPSMLTADEANAKYGELGLSFDKPVPASWAATVAENKQAEIERQKIMARTKGIGAGAAYLGGALYGSLQDPINVGLSFVPIVGQARYARMVERMGVRGARLSKGAIEGAAGAAIVEPMVYAGAQTQQYNYGFADSLLNVAVGGVMGGGLHFAGGEVRDFWVSRKTRTLAETGAPPQATRLDEKIDLLPTEEKANALRAAIGQMAKGEELNVDFALKRVLDEIPFDNAEFETRVSRLEQRVRVFESGPLEGNKYARYTKPTPAQLKGMESAIAELNQAEKGYKLFDYSQEGIGGSPVVSGVKGTFPKWAKDLNANESTSRKQINAVFEKLKKGEPLGKREFRIARSILGAGDEYRERAARDYAAYRADRKMRQNLEDAASIDATAQREAKFWEGDISPEENIITRAEELGDDIEKQLADIQTLIDAERQLGNLTEEEMAALDMAQEFEIEAESGGRGILAAATCIYRKL